MRFFIFVSIITLSLTASAKEYSLKAIVERFVENSPDVQAAKANFTASHHDMKKAASKFFPNLSLNGSITDYKNPTISAFPGTATTGKQYLGSLDVVQPLFAGGAIWRGLQVAKLNRTLQEQTYLNTKQEAIAGILLSSLQLAAVKEQIKIVEESQKYQERFYNLTKSKVARGAAKDYELSQTRADLLSYQSRLENLNQAARDAEERLRVNLDLSDEDHIEVALPPLVRVEASEAKSLLEQAIQNRPAVRMAEINVEIARQSKWLNLSDELPSLNFVGSVGYKSPTQEDFSKDTTKFHSVGLALKIPLFSGLSSLNKYQSGEESIRTAEFKLASTRRSLKQEVETALESLGTSARLIESSGEWVKESRKALNSSIDSYRIGVISSVQVIQVQRGWESAELSLTTARQNFHLALLNLRKAIGTDLEQVYTEKSTGGVK